MRMQCSFLSESEKQKIHEDTLKILSAVGVRFMSPKALKLLAANGAGIDLINGIGELETSQLLVLEQIVVDHEIARLCKRMKDGVEVSDAKNYFADISNVKPGGHFLMEPSTLEACHSSEFLMPDLFDRNPHDLWAALGKPEVYPQAREKVEEILAAPQKNPLPDKTIGRLEDIMRRADQEISTLERTN